MADIAVRVRLASGQTLKLRVATSISYEQLVAQAAEGAGIPAAGAQLSLNKKDPLTTSPAVAVSQLGLCSGDLVFLLSDAHEGYAAVAPPAPRPTLVHSAAPPNRPSEIATASPAATSDALLSASLARLAEMGFEPAAARAALER